MPGTGEAFDLSVGEAVDGVVEGVDEGEGEPPPPAAAPAPPPPLATFRQPVPE